MNDACDKVPYELGAACAIAGGRFDENPYRDCEPLDFMQWNRGFHDNQTFDPSCSVCRGTGKRKLNSSWKNESIPLDLDYDGAEIACVCNIVSRG